MEQNTAQNFDPILVNENNNPFYVNQNTHDILTHKKILNNDITAKELRKQVENNAAYFANFIINEIKEISPEEPIIYNITTKEEDLKLTQSLKGSLLVANIPNHITIQIDGINLKLTPALPSNDVTEQKQVKKTTLLDLFNYYSKKTGEKDFEIVALSLEEQIEALSKAHQVNIAKAELDAWQQTLKTLLKDAKGIKELTQVQTYVEKTQAIIRILNQPFNTLAKRQTALKQAVNDFDQMIKAKSEKDCRFHNGLLFAWCALLTVSAILMAISAPIVFAISALIFVVIMPPTMYLIDKYARHEVFEATSPGLVSRALSQLGIFHYTPYKKTALTFSDRVGNEEMSNFPDAVKNVDQNAATENLTPVYLVK